MEIIYSKNQLPIPVINGMPLHSKINPSHEAKSFSRDVGEKLIPVVLGLGFAYHLQNFEPDLIVIEPDEKLIREFKIHFPQSQIEPISGTTSQIVRSLSQKIQGHQIRDVKIKIHQPSLRARPALYQNLFQVLQQWQEKGLLNLISDSAFGALWTKNALNHLNQLGLKAPKISNSSSSPVLILGSGYSLSLHIETIKQYQSRLIIIAIPPVLELLKKHGIRPDMVLLVDGGHANRFYYNSLDVPLLCYLTSSALYTRNWKEAPVLFFRSGLPIEDLLIPGHPLLPISGSAANTALDLASRIANEVWICGFDFSFIKSYYHYPGNPLEKELLFQSSYESSQEGQLLKLMLRGEANEIRSRNGGKLKTNLSMASYYQDFCDKIKNCSNVDFYDLSGEGPFFPGVKQKDLSLIGRYPEKKLTVEALQLDSPQEKIKKLNDLKKIYQNASSGKSHPITDMHLSRFYLKKLSIQEEVKSSIKKIEKTIKQLKNGV